MTTTTTNHLTHERITVEDVLALKPCSDYPRRRVKSLWGERESLTLLEALELKIPAEDRLWLALRRDFFSDQELRLMAADFAERAVLAHWRDTWDFRPAAAVVAVRRYARGELGAEELSAAEAAAEAAARAAWAAWDAGDAARAARAARAAAGESAAWSAAGAAEADAGAAAWSAARSAAWSAARDAAQAAAEAAAQAAAWDAEREAQVDIVRRYLGVQP